MIGAIFVSKAVISASVAGGSAGGFFLRMAFFAVVQSVCQSEGFPPIRGRVIFGGELRLFLRIGLDHSRPRRSVWVLSRRGGNGPLALLPGMRLVS